MTNTAPQSVTLRFDVDAQRRGSTARTESAPCTIREFVIAGWTGRDTAAIEHHIEELAKLGVPRPSAVPLFYRVGVGQLCQADSVQMLGADSSGEVEPVVVAAGGELLLTIGSDHTDRKVEAYSVAVSKQMCAKPLARAAWRLAEVVGHWDRLIIRSFIAENGERVRYQEGPLSGMCTTADLIGRYTGGATTLPEGTVMFCGTVGAIGGVRPSSRFEFEIEDPVLGRRISAGYDIVTLPVVA